LSHKRGGKVVIHIEGGGGGQRGGVNSVDGGIHEPGAHALRRKRKGATPKNQGGYDKTGVRGEESFHLARKVKKGGGLYAH